LGSVTVLASVAPARQTAPSFAGQSLAWHVRAVWGGCGRVQRAGLTAALRSGVTDHGQRWRGAEPRDAVLYQRRRRGN